MSGRTFTRRLRDYTIDITITFTNEDNYMLVISVRINRKLIASIHIEPCAIGGALSNVNADYSRALTAPSLAQLR